MNYAWRVVAFTLLMQAMSYGILVYAFGLFVVPWLDDFNASRANVMLAILLLSIIVGLVSPVIGRMLDRYPSAWIVPLGGLMLGTGLLLVSMAGAMWQIILIYATVLPLAAALNGPLAAQTITTQWFEKKRGLALGISAAGTSLGGFAIPLLIGPLLGTVGWRITLQILAVLAVLSICPLAYLVLRRRAPTFVSGPASGLSNPTAYANRTEWTTFRMLRTRDFWLPALALLPVNVAFAGIQFNLAAYAQDLGNSVSRSALLISLMALSTIAGKLSFGALTDWIDHRKLYWLSALAMATSLVLIQDAPSYPTLCLCSVLSGLSIGGMLPLVGAIYSNRFGVRSFGRVAGWVMLLLTFGGVGPYIAGAAFDRTGSYDVAFTIFLTILVPAALGMLALRKN